MTNPTYESAAAAEKEGSYKEALRLYHSLLADASSSDKPMINEAIQRVIDIIYGPKGSDESICIWKPYPLLSKSKPPPLQFRATCQMGDKIYVHGGCDFCENDVLPINDEVWEFDITNRKWKKIPTGGKSPGPRTGHSMFPWKGDLYLWGGMMEDRRVTQRYFFSQLYRLNMSGNGPVHMWEVVKVRSLEPVGREEHAGVLYKGKYYVHGGNNPHVVGSALRDTWVLNLNNFKWSKLKDGPVTRHCHCMWAGNNKLYVLGGRTDIPQEGDFSLMNVCNPSIEDFVSFDLGTKTWKYEDLVGEYRPHDLSEFTVLPLYDKDENEPSSVVIWGGYCEPERATTFTLTQLKDKYGDEHEEFRLPYKKRLLRFDMSTNVWKPLKPTSPVLPKAQSFMSFLKSENGIAHFLIGGGYGIDPDHDTRELSEKSDAEFRRLYQDALARGHTDFPPDYQSYMERKKVSHHKPQYSNKVYEVLVTESFGDRGDSKAGWFWDFHKLPDDKMPRVASMIHPTSPTLHNVVDLSLDDFLQSRCDSVKANDQKNLFGVRVKIHGLQGRKDLNGDVGRCGRWLEKTGRYEVFQPLYENGGKFSSISVKPENLLIADAVTIEELEELVTTISADKRFPRALINLGRAHHSQRPPLDDITDPTPIEGGKIFSIFDTYHGPLSREAHAVLRTLADPQKANNQIITCTLIAKEFTDEERRNPATKDISEGSMLFSEFVKDLKAKDSVRTAAFEASMAKISDSMVDEKCGKWLKMVVQLDGIQPTIRREFVVSPAVTMRALHDQVLCPIMGWKSNYHSYAFRKIYDDLEKLKDSCWIGPRTSTSLDSMFMPLYIGGSVASDKQISIGQLFVSEDNDDDYVTRLQYVHDLGDWYSHSIEVSRYDGQSVPTNASVAYLIKGEGLNVPEDAGGLFFYEQLIGRLTGRFQMKIGDNGLPGEAAYFADDLWEYTDPSSEHWWNYFNAEVRNKSNMQRSLGNPLEFDLDLARNDLEVAIRRPTQKSGKESVNLHSMDIRTGLMHEKDKKVTAHLPKDATKLCAVCGVTVALRKCSGCKSVAYCSREHQLDHWKEHKAACKRIQKSK